MKSYFFAFIMTFSPAFLLYAQDEENIKGKLYLAPDFSLMLGSINQIEVSPAVGYHISERFSAGAGLKYEFYSQTRIYSNQNVVKTHIYGPRTFMRYLVVNNLGEFLPIGMHTAVFAHAEIETNSLEKKYFDKPNYSENGRFWYTTFLIGGGFSQAASQNININVLLLWDIDDGYISLYNNPVIRFGLQIYLRPSHE